MKTENKSNSKFWVRMMAWILSILMVVSLAYFSIVMIVDYAETRKEERAAAQQKEQTADDVGHDHDGDGTDDH